MLISVKHLLVLLELIKHQRELEYYLQYIQIGAPQKLTANHYPPPHHNFESFKIWHRTWMEVRTILMWVACLPVKFKFSSIVEIWFCPILSSLLLISIISQNEKSFKKQFSLSSSAACIDIVNRYVIVALNKGFESFVMQKLKSYTMAPHSLSHTEDFNQVTSSIHPVRKHHSTFS